ncbi:unnamed protein product, partial [marine sediment metagenome]
MDDPLFVPDNWAMETHSETDPTGGESGFSTGRAILLILAASMCAALVFAKAEQATPARKATVARVKPTVLPKVPVMDVVKLTIDGPDMSKDGEKSAKVTAEFAFSATDPVSFVILKSSAVVTDVDLGSNRLRFTSRPQGYVLNVLRAGDYKVSLTYLLPVTEKAGKWSIELGILPNLKNEVVLRLPDKELDVLSNEAVYLTSKEKGDKGTEVSAVFGPVQKVGFTWQPRVRKTKLEKVVFFCEVNTFALFKPGVVELTNLVRF